MGALSGPRHGKSRETYPTGSGARGVGLARVRTPNPLAVFTTGFVPSTDGSLLAVIDITPTQTGLLDVSVQLSCSSSGTDIPGIVLGYLNDLTAVTGGTLYTGVAGAGIWTPTTPGTPASMTTTPALGTAVAVDADAETVNASDQAFLTLVASVQAVPGVRTGLLVSMTSPSDRTYEISAAMKAFEQSA